MKDSDLETVISMHSSGVLPSVVSGAPVTTVGIGGTSLREQAGVIGPDGPMSALYAMPRDRLSNRARAFHVDVHSGSVGGLFSAEFIPGAEVVENSRRLGLRPRDLNAHCFRGEAELCVLHYIDVLLNGVPKDLGTAFACITEGTLDRDVEGVGRAGDWVTHVKPALKGDVLDARTLPYILSPVSAAISAQYQKRYLWHVGFTHNRVELLFPTDPVGAREVFRDREKGERDRRAALIHWVRAHLRRRKDESADFSEVRSHLRGAARFDWRGFQCRILPSAFDREQEVSRRAS